MRSVVTAGIKSESIRTRVKVVQLVEKSFLFTFVRISVQVVKVGAVKISKTK